MKIFMEPFESGNFCLAEKLLSQYVRLDLRAREIFALIPRDELLRLQVLYKEVLKEDLDVYWICHVNLMLERIEQTLNGQWIERW